MTIPWLMNCPHTSSGLCLECVKKLRKDTLEDAAKLCDIQMEVSDPGSREEFSAAYCAEAIRALK